MKKLRIVPILVVAGAVGLAISMSAGPSNASNAAPAESRTTQTGANENGFHAKEPVGSGQDNLYSTEGDEIPQTGNPGQDLFTRHCSSCHGPNGAGSEQGPSLIGVGQAAIDFYISTGRMPLRVGNKQAPRDTPVLNEEQTAAIATYIDSIKPGPPIPHVDLEKGDLVEGNELFANNCAACHNSAGSGGALSGEYYAPALDEATPVQVAEAIRVGPGAMPVFGPGAFSDHEVDSLVKYVEHLRTEEHRGGLPIGKFGPVAEGFVAWIIGLGALLAISRWMGTRT